MRLTTVSKPAAVEPRPRGEGPADEAVVSLTDVGVRFRIPTERITSFKEYVIRRITRRIGYRDLWALNHVSLDLRRGEFVGVVGPNGAGKSTLLKVIARVLRPTRGRVRVVGNVAPMLELGAGFHSDLTGRENVFLNATLLGHPRTRVAEHFNAIVDFAELWDFIDMPVRNYSSGMLARLGFAVATAFQPDILLLDEVLAVGDTRFQGKCMERVHLFRRHGTAILLVTHNLEFLARNCRRIFWIDAGRLRMDGPPEEVIPRYRRALMGESEPRPVPSS